MGYHLTKLWCFCDYCERKSFGNEAVYIYVPSDMSITYILGIHSFFAEKGIGIVWLSLPLFEFKQNFGSSDRTLTVKFSLVLAFGAHRGVA